MNSMVDLSSSLCKRLPFRVAVHDFETSKKTSPDRWIASPPTKRPEPLGLVLGGLVDLAFNWQFSFPRAPPMHIARYLLAGHRWETWETSDLVSARNFGLKKTVVPPVRKWSFFFFFRIRMVIWRVDLISRWGYDLNSDLSFCVFFEIWRSQYHQKCSNSWEGE